MNHYLFHFIAYILFAPSSFSLNSFVSLCILSKMAYHKPGRFSQNIKIKQLNLSFYFKSCKK